MSGSAREHAYDVLRRGIADGTYPAGSWLREEDVAAAAGVSRTPIREALHRLQAEGLVQLMRHRGALVVGWTEDDLDNLYELRTTIEGYGAGRAALHRTSDQLEHLQKLCTTMDELLPTAGEEEMQQLGVLCVEFHNEIHRASGNRQLAALMPSILAPPFVSEAFHHHTRLELERSFDHHRELVQAIEAQDREWAEAIMCAHLRHGRQSLRRMERHLRFTPGEE
jgi:DNA-binding GntR family transcriptional regulator